MKIEDTAIEKLARTMANAKLGEGDSVRCEGPTEFEVGQARPWARRALAALATAPAPASGGVDAVGVCGISADTESKRVLKLHFKHEVTDADRKTIIDAFNTLNRERRSALSPAATPVSEAGGEFEVSHRIAVLGLKAALARPASSPAGGDVVEQIARMIAPEAFKAFDDDYRPGQAGPSSAQMRAIGPMNKARETARAILALSQSTSAGRVGE